MNISKDKQYTTGIVGQEPLSVRIYATDGHPVWPIHGAVKILGQWRPQLWNKKGENIDATFRLIEVKPRIKRTVWLTITENSQQVFKSKGCALDWIIGLGEHSIVKVEIDCEHGEGLNDDQ